MPRTFGDMIDRIADETTWSTIDTQIARAIKDAVDQYSAERFWFNDQYRTTATLSSASSTLIIPTTILSVSRVRLLSSSTEYTVTPRDRDYIEAMLEGDTGATSRPIHYSIFGYDSATFSNVMVFDARADADYPIILDGLRKFDELSATTDAGPWVNEAERLIRYAAKRILYNDTIREPGEAMIAEAGEASALADLVAETSRRMATGRIRPTQW